MAATTNLIGQRFGSLVVLAMAGRGEKGIYWKCRCDCGNTREHPTSRLRTTRSCGCLVVKVNTTHGHSKTKEYRIWAGIKTRCGTPSATGFADYGGRGIKMCERWRDGTAEKSAFECFLEDMGPRPSPGHSIERDDTNGDYEPSNCRWATRIEQNRNARSNIYYTHNGETRLLVEWAEKFGLKINTARSRVRSGRPLDAPLVLRGRWA